MNKKFKLLNILLCFVFIFSSSIIYINADETQMSASGSVKSNTGTKLNLRIDYIVTQNPDETQVTVTASVYLEYIRLRINDERIATVSINGQSSEFKTGRIWVDNDSLHELSVHNFEVKLDHTYGEPLDLKFQSSGWILGGTYSGTYVGEITIDETVTINFTESVTPPISTIPPETSTSTGYKIPNTVYKSAVEFLQSNKKSTSGDKNFHMAGTITSHTGTHLTLRVEWVADQEQGSDTVKIRADVYLDYMKMYLPARNGSIDIGGAVREFVTPEMNVSEETNHSDLIATHNVTVKREWGQGVVVRVNAKWYLGAKYTNTQLSWVEAVGSIVLSEKYEAMTDSTLIDVESIMQNPELPNGCEVTSLAMVLNKLGYTVDKLTLNDKYLDIGPVGLTNYYTANIGNPRDANSFGSYSPVIVNTAVKYIEDNGKNHSVYEITGYNIDEVYYQLSQGNPVIVWITQDINTKPLVTKTWVIDGQTLNWKHPLHCVVLTGYDMNAKTVTLVDPILGIVTHSMDLFELRWMEMGAQALYIK